MSVNAIIGYKREDGTFVGGLQWNNAGKLTNVLKSYFNSKEKIDNLISNGLWLCINSNYDNSWEIIKRCCKNNDTEFFIENCIMIKFEDNDEILKDEIFQLIRELLDDNSGMIIFPSLDLVKDYGSKFGINYLYEYDCHNKTWLAPIEIN